MFKGKSKCLLVSWMGALTGCLYPPGCQNPLLCHRVILLIQCLYSIQFNFVIDESSKIPVVKKHCNCVLYLYLKDMEKYFRSLVYIALILTFLFLSWMDRLLIAGSPFRVNIQESSPFYPDKVKCFGPGLNPRGVRKGEKAVFSVVTNQAGVANLEVFTTDVRTGMTSDIACVFVHL